MLPQFFLFIVNSIATSLSNFSESPAGYVLLNFGALQASTSALAAESQSFPLCSQRPLANVLVFVSLVKYLNAICTKTFRCMFI